MNGKWIPLGIAVLCAIISIEVLPVFILSEIFWLFAMAYFLLWGFWDQLGKDPEQKNAPDAGNSLEQ